MEREYVNLYRNALRDAVKSEKRLIILEYIAIAEMAFIVLILAITAARRRK